MTTEAFDPEAHLDHMAKLHGLVIAPEWRQGVVANIAAAARMAALVTGGPLDSHDEPAIVFEADR